MTSVTPELQNDHDAISKEIEAILIMMNEDNFSASSTCESGSTSDVKSAGQMLEKYFRETLREPGKFVDYDEFISSEFPFYQQIPKSTVLEDKKLFEAILFSKIFDDCSTFEANRENVVGKLVWFHVNLDDVVMLVSEDEIIYSMYRATLDQIRENVSKTRTVLETINEGDLAEVLGASHTLQDQSKPASDLQSSQDAAFPCNAPSTSSNVDRVYAMADLEKEVLLNELNSIPNLDPFIKEGFEFDLHDLPNKSMDYWCGRLDGLRSFSRSSQVSQELQQLIQVGSNLNQAGSNLETFIQDYTATLASLREEIKAFTQTQQKHLKEITKLRSDIIL